MGCCFSKPKTTEAVQLNVAAADQKPTHAQTKPETQVPTPSQQSPNAQQNPPNQLLTTAEAKTQTTDQLPSPPPVSQPPPGYPGPVEPTDQRPPKPQPNGVQPPLSIPSVPTLEDCESRFAKINNASDVDRLIDLIDQLLQSLLNKPRQEKTLHGSTSSQTHSDTLKDTAKSIWTSFLKSGSAFLEFLNKHVQQEKADEGTRKAVAKILQEVGKVHWIVAGLSVVAFVLEQIGQISDNRSECIELLKQMSKLAGHIRKLKYDMPQEEKILNEAVVLIVEGSMMCASQLKSGTLFRILKASVDSLSLASLQSKINQVYQDLILRVTIEIHHQQPVAFYPWKSIYPDYAVGIEEQKKQVTKLLGMEIPQKSPLAVVIYGFGGIGKTTLASAVIAELDLTDYNCSGLQMQEDRFKNDIKSMQQQILKDAFPAYTYDRNVTLRNSAEGRDHLAKAFEVQKNKPVFLFIDNALRTEDLQELFPKSLRGLPQCSRILVTTRNLGVTDMLKGAGLARREHSVGTLSNKDALKILFRDSNQDNVMDIEGENVQNTLQICAGIPLVLEIVGARLRKQNCVVEKCTQIFEALRTGRDVKEENLSKRLINSVYDDLEASTQEAFLDICCFFVSWSRRHVECIVGAEEVTHLEEAALFKTSDTGNVIVHDIIRAKGQSMSESTRISGMQSLVDVVSDNTKLEQIKGVWLSRKDTEPANELDEKHIFQMKNSLRVLALGNQIINVSRSDLQTPKFKELRFLRLGGDISGLWPVNLESLERLAVYHGPLFKDGVTLCKLPKKLRVIKATAQSEESAKSLESIPTNVSQNSFLEELDLKELKSLQRLPQWLSNLTELKVLILDEWDKMQELSEQVWRRTSLCKLSICGGISLQNLPISFGQLTSLQELILTSCKKLEKLPSTFGDLSSLKQLNLAECVMLKELTESFGRLTSLEVLNLEKCWKLEALPASFGQLRLLKKLSLQSYDLKELPCSFRKLSSLEELKLSGCLELKELPKSFGQLASLTHLDLSCCMKLKSLPPSIGELRSLKYFNLSACFLLEELPSNIGDLPSLAQLDLRRCDSLKERPQFANSNQRNQRLTIWFPG